MQINDDYLIVVHWNHIIVYRLFLFYRNTSNYMILCKQIIMEENCILLMQ